MRKMMLAATMMFAACAAEQSGSNGDDDGSGSSGMDAGVPTTCTSAEDCGDDRACDLTTHECVTGGLTIEPTEQVINDGAEWWTSVGDPTVKGTFEGPASAVIQVTVGSGDAVTATLQGNMWSAKLAAGSITPTGVQLKVTMTGGAALELVQTFKLDTLAPQVSIATSNVRDERGDTIDFSTGEPVHTHAGADIDLASGSCPSVYKYAYLMDAQNPTFGSQASQNPLAWNFSVVDANITTASYRVRNANNQVVLDWAPLMPAPSGAYRVDLRRDMLPMLGTYAGQLTVDMRARDWMGLETTFSGCVDYHPLAAPLRIEALQLSTTPTPDAPPLLAMSFAADSPIWQLAGNGFGASIVTQRIVQYTNEPIHISLTGGITNLRVTRTYVDDYVPAGTLAGSTCATGCSDVPADPPDSVLSGPATSWAYFVALIDDTTNELVTSYPPTIPARAANEAPHSYRAVAYLSQLSDLRHPQLGTPGPYSLNMLAYSGFAPGAPTYVCTATITKYINGEPQEICTQTTAYRRIVALDKATVQADAMSIAMKTSPAATVTPTEPSYAPASLFTMGALSWDGGDDDLPGAH